jgi:hypothetical protein
MTLRKRARVAANARWKDPAAREKARVAMRARMKVAWAVAKALEAVEKVKEAQAA